MREKASRVNERQCLRPFFYGVDSSTLLWTRCTLEPNHWPPVHRSGEKIEIRPLVSLDDRIPMAPK